MVSKPLKSRDDVPTHLPTTNAIAVTKLGAVRDAVTGHELKPIVDESFSRTVRSHHAAIRSGSPKMHLYLIADGKIYHTRDLVTIEVE